MVQKANMLVMVGIPHLSGEEGVISLLKRKGHSVEVVTLNDVLWANPAKSP
ncbi:hypothetical protein GCM10007860_25760 [Chitiniphilus shinanonensis]|uniref:TraB family protein n=1 Tax=Chitiniphilus shinanonensis TaxID=553088 RepID=A0ABQ6BTV3_9NEIS|nr:hypothetical protein [Chitiniphilus shinanonensis]GLS05423.1 hypothetical protein GCM10007860_25760 [Chitiniphilus shinanonensis]